MMDTKLTIGRSYISSFCDFNVIEQRWEEIQQTIPEPYTELSQRFKEIFRLRTMLETTDIPFEFIDRTEPAINYEFYQIIIINPITNERMISVIEGENSFGYQTDLLEIMGCLTNEEALADRVVGRLTAEDVFERIKTHWSYIQNERK